MACFKIIENQKGGETLLRCGFKYNLHRKNRDDSTLWRCVNRDSCLATITVDARKVKVLREKSHGCSANIIKCEVAEVLALCKKMVCQNLAPIQKIFEDMFEPLRKKGRNYIREIPPFESVKNTLYRIRKRFCQSDKLRFENLEDVQISKTFANNFFVLEDGTTNKILIFSSLLCRKIIKNANNKSFYGDGTFKACPKPFFQLFSVHLDIKSSEKSINVFPVIYGLLPSKTEETYTRFFILLKEKLHLNINTYKCDYERAQINAVRNVFPNASISGCFHHYNEAIIKKSRELGLDDTREGRNITNLCSLLPLLPTNYIQEGWSSIVQIAPEISVMNNFKAYFNRQWYPLLTDIVSSAYDDHRTTNSLEGWHRRLNSRISKSPNLFYFIKCLLHESVHYDYKIKYILFNPPKNNRRIRDIYFDKKYKRYLTKLQSEVLLPLQFLRKIIYLRLKC